MKRLKNKYRPQGIILFGSAARGELKEGSDIDFLVGDASKARRAFGWKPSVTFDELVQLMVEADLVASQAQSSQTVRV